LEKERPAMPSPMASTQKKKFAGFGLNNIVYIIAQ